MKFFRWKGIIPLMLFLVLVAAAWYFYLDTFVEHSVEDVGADIVGAKVDLESADVQLTRGTVVLTGLHVADPDSPMRNLFEATEIIAAIATGPLLEKKLVIDSLLVHGVRFGTPRTESGALKNPNSTSGLAVRRVNEWVKQIRIPPFTLEGLGQVVNIPGISLDSLRTVSQARAILSATDSLRRSWEAQVRDLDPQPRIDSAQQLVERLRVADVRVLGVGGTRDLIADTRRTLDGLTGTLNQVKRLEQGVSDGVSTMQANVASLEGARQADYTYARGLVRLPSLEAPDISPALFGQLGLERLKPLLYWLEIAEKYMPPGLDPRRTLGPKRARAPGVTVDYPRPETYPKFLLRFADVDFSFGGENLAAGAYRAQLAGLTTEPALYGRPLQLTAQRSGGKVGPRTVRVFAQLDHTKPLLRDSAAASVGGLTLPTVAIPPLGATVALGEGVADLMLSRVGDNLVARWYVRTTNAKWEQTVRPPRPAGSGSAQDQARALVEDLLWRTISGVHDVEIEAQMSGTLARPALSVRSNIGSVVAQSLKRAVGEEVARAERLIRAKVDSMVDERVAEARAGVDGVKTQVQAKIEGQRAELERVKAELEQKIRDLTPRLPGGIRLPGQGDE